MNRMEEFQELIKELEIPHPELEGTLDRVIRRKRRQNAVIRPLMGFVASICINCKYFWNSCLCTFSDSNFERTGTGGYVL